MNASIPAGCKKFHAAITPMAVLICVTALIIVICTDIDLKTYSFNFYRELLAVGAGIATSFACSGLFSLLYPAAFSADGIYGHSFWGFRRFFRWQNVAKTRTFSIFNLPWLRVFDADGRVLWLPLFQRNRKDFREEIQKFVPPGNPVLKFLESWPA
jgi:hypothetical protein